MFLNNLLIYSFFASTIFLLVAIGGIVTLLFKNRKLSFNNQYLLNEKERLTATLIAEREVGSQRLKELKDCYEDQKIIFKQLAQETLEDRSKILIEQSKDSISSVVTPLKNRLDLFQTKLEEVNRLAGNERLLLGEQIKQLIDQNISLSTEANNLAQALKGNNKLQGDWGEVLLERILESAGLVKGTHFKTQVVYATNNKYDEEDSSLKVKLKVQPDVIIELPEGRHLIVDAKVSLRSYQQYTCGEDCDNRDIHLKKHVESLTNHIKSLANKDYGRFVTSGTSLDFVLMFVAIEPALHLALATNKNLWDLAWKHNVLLVGPSTLLLGIRTIANLWRQEQQHRNTLEIVNRGAELYDKFSNFVEDLQSVGKSINASQKSYEAAYKKLKSGKGNLIRQVEMLRELGVNARKPLSAEIISDALEG
jgi:DNA recombination protein RmuC